jgi:hypothetical protein
MGNELNYAKVLIEDEKLWEKFKSIIKKDINTELIEMVREKTKKRDKK